MSGQTGNQRRTHKRCARCGIAMAGKPGVLCEPCTETERQFSPGMLRMWSDRTSEDERTARSCRRLAWGSVACGVAGLALNLGCLMVVLGGYWPHWVWRRSGVSVLILVVMPALGLALGILGVLLAGGVRWRENALYERVADRGGLLSWCALGLWLLAVPSGWVWWVSEFGLPHVDPLM